MQQFTQPPLLDDLISYVPNFKYLLWDMDGTIMQTEPLHLQAIISMIKKYHKDIKLNREEIELTCIGATDRTCLEELQHMNFLKDMAVDNFIAEKNTAIVSLLESDFENLKTLIHPKIYKLIRDLHHQSYTQVVVTSSEREIAHLMLKKLGIAQYMSFVLTREDTVENKPSPTPYLVAMEKLQAAKEECLIFEDSSIGLMAAQKSGAHYIKASWY